MRSNIRRTIRKQHSGSGTKEKMSTLLFLYQLTQRNFKLNFGSQVMEDFAFVAQLCEDQALCIKVQLLIKEQPRVCYGTG